MASASDVIKIAQGEIGYLEKKSNSQLDSKTANVGSNNYTKYWRDLNAAGYQGQAWCNAFVNWCFVKAFGTEKAKVLLCTAGGWSYYTPTSAGYFKNKGQWYTSNPQAGDVIYFKNTKGIHHVGIVSAVSGGRVSTIEGNTSGGSAVIANGGGVCAKSYVLGNSCIAGYGRPAYDGAESSTPATPSVPQSTDYSSKDSSLAGNYSVTASSLRMRKTPVNGTVITSVAKGGVVSTDGTYTIVNGIRWLYCSYGAYSGYMSTQYLTKYVAPTPTPTSTPTQTSTGYSKSQFIKDVQKSIGVTVDGIVGPKTLGACPTISASKNNRHAVVKYLQQYLNTIGYNCGTADGVAGAKFTAAAKAFQGARGLSADGIFGKNSWTAILK